MGPKTPKTCDRCVYSDMAQCKRYPRVFIGTDSYGAPVFDYPLSAGGCGEYNNGEAAIIEIKRSGTRYVHTRCNTISECDEELPKDLAGIVQLGCDYCGFNFSANEFKVLDDAEPATWPIDREVGRA